VRYLWMYVRYLWMYVRYLWMYVRYLWMSHGADCCGKGREVLVVVGLSKVNYGFFVRSRLYMTDAFGQEHRIYIAVSCHDADVRHTPNRQHHASVS